MSARSLSDTKVQQASEDEEEEEEHLVLVELTGIIDSDILEKCDNKCKILGINTEKPFLQVDKYVFAGEYEDALGTCVIFEETVDQGDGDNTKPNLKYKCHTVKKLNMTRTFLTEKKDGDEGGGKIEWFQIKDDSSNSWPQTICSFAQENEDADESPSEDDDDDHEHLDESTEDAPQMERTLDPDEKHDCDSKEKAAIELQGKELSNQEEKTEVTQAGQQPMDTDKVGGGSDDKLFDTAEGEVKLPKKTDYS